MHTIHCGHAKGSVQEMVEAAMKKGVETVGFAEHFPYPPDVPDLPGDSIASSESFKQYIQDVGIVQKKYSNRIHVLLGAEVDYHPQYMEWIRNQLSRTHFDYLIGSVHLLDGKPIDFNQEYLNRLIQEIGGESDFWNQYWEAVHHLLDEPWLNVVGHLDLPRKFLSCDFAFSDQSMIRKILQKIKHKDLAIDVNTSGIAKTTDQQIYPAPIILRVAAVLDVDVMIGSDAHAPEEIGRAFESTRQLLLSSGFSHYVTFEKGQKNYHYL